MAVENNLCTIAWNVFCIASFDVIYKVEGNFCIADYNIHNEVF